MSGSRHGQVYTLEALISAGIILLAVTVAIYHPTGIESAKRLQLKKISEDVLTLLTIDYYDLSTNRYTNTTIYYYLSQYQNGNTAYLNYLANYFNKTFRYPLRHALGVDLSLNVYEYPYKKPILSTGKERGVSTWVFVVVRGKVYEIVVSAWYL